MEVIGKNRIDSKSNIYNLEFSEKNGTYEFNGKIKEDAQYKYLRAYYDGNWYKTSDFVGGEWATIIATRKNADGTWSYTVGQEAIA